MKLSFVGLGSMGSAMADSLLSAGHDLCVYNRSPVRAAPFREKGARVALTPAQAAHGAEIVISMLADDAAVEHVMFGKEGVISGLAPGALHVSSSTISVALSERLASAHAVAKQAYVVATVFGRPDAAAARQLWVLAAGSTPHIDRCLPVLQALGRGVTRLGENPSLANVVKLAGNFLIASTNEALGEAFALTRKAGVAPDVFLELFVNVFARSPIFENYAKLIAHGAYEPAGLKVHLGLKDLRLALAAAETLEVPMPQAALVRDQLQAALDGGKGDLDWSAIALLAAERAGLK